MKQKEKWADTHCMSKDRPTDRGPWRARYEGFLAVFEFAKHQCILKMSDTPHASFRLEAIGEDEVNEE